MDFLFVLLPHFHEEEDVKEMHRSQNQKDKADLGSKNFEDILVVDDGLDHLEVEYDEAEVDEIKPDDQQMVDAVSEFFTALAAIDQKDAAVFVKGAGDPDRERQGDDEIESVSQ